MVTYRQDILFGRNKIVRNETIVILVLVDIAYQLFILDMLYGLTLDF